ncbi:hypothetical protein D3C86_1860590 [compost metagenome]
MADLNCLLDAMENSESLGIGSVIATVIEAGWLPTEGLVHECRFLGAVFPSVPSVAHA